MLDEAMRRIQEAKRTRQTALDLSELFLQELPEAVCELTALTELDLSENRLAALPEAIGNLTALEKLNLFENRLTVLPDSIGRLGALTRLYLDSNRLAGLPVSIGDLAALEELSLARNDLDRLPESIGELGALTGLDLSYNELATLPQSIGDLGALTSLDLSDNELATLPESIGRLTGLNTLDLADNDIPELPESIGNLVGLHTLELERNRLRSLPDSFKGLTALRVLRLGDNRLTVLPETIGRLTALTELHLDSNRLTALPADIGRLTALTELHLDSNRLTALPADIGRLTALTELDLDDNRLASLPESIGNLTALTELIVRKNGLRTLPESLGNLVALTVFDVWSNDLEALPESIGNLTALTELDLSFNRLASLPESIGNLTALTELDLSYNLLASVPEPIGSLTALTDLKLHHNRLAAVPESIGDLTALTNLELDENRLSNLPETIGNLTALDNLELQANRLTALPEQLAALTGLETLQVEENPLPPEITAASASGFTSLMAFLDEVATSGVTVREAKLVLVGEGAVGKSTLLSAMLGEPFEVDRSSTHGIEVRPLTLAQGQPGECVLNAWDFGGQPTYRPTHQLFFTAPAVYLVVWKPRHGPRQDNVEEWIELIRRRAGDDVRIHVVATHGGPKNRYAHIDEARILQAHSEVIAGFHHVDSVTGDGIEQLKDAIQATASGLPYFTRKLPASWRRFQDDLRRAPDPYLEYREYLSRAAEHDLTEASAKTLAIVATALGHWCYYPNIAGLDQLVVLKGDWLSAAVSLVIDDPRAVRDHGLVEHSNLKQIWDDPANPPHLRYPEKVHRILLRLMEEYEISYRVSGGHGSRPPTSLIAQLVDPRTPPLDSWEEYGRNLSVQTRICKFSDASENFHIPEGLIYRLIVRLHQFSLGRERYEQSLHWTQGLVIDHGIHGRALIRLERNQLTVAVKAVAPEYLLTMVVEEIRDHVGEFWQGVKVHTFVSCGRSCEDPDDSRLGQWEVERLFRRRMKGKHEITCASCDEDIPIQALLSGVSTPLTLEDRFAMAVEAALDPVFIAQVDQVRKDGYRIKADAGNETTKVITRAESHLQDILKSLEDEAVLGPRLFTVRVDEGRGSVLYGEGLVNCWVTLWCEYSRKPTWLLRGHREEQVYRLAIRREWLVRAAPWLNAVAMLLKVALPTGVEGLSPSLADQPWSAIEAQAGLTRRTFINAAALTGNGQGDFAAPGDDRPGVLLRELHALIRGQDPEFGGLIRIRSRGRILWVDPCFEARFNPGLPEMGGDGR